jgi:TctA family transporter
MDLTILDAVGQGLVALGEPTRLGFLFLGVLIGLFIGILPGIGGLTALALLLPFTFSMDTYAAFALLLGVSATAATGDTIPAVLFGVPGGAGSAATVLDGFPMTRRGEAGRALSAAYLSSLLGGIFGAILLAAAVPLIRPVMMYFGSPELLAFAILGVSMVAVLSGGTPLRGMAAAGVGILLAMIGMDSQTGTTRWNFDTMYLWDGLPLVPVILGLFALPELCDLAISRSAIAAPARSTMLSGMLQGAKDVMRNWFLVLRCSWIGAAFGAMPGISGSVIDWLAYGYAARTVKGGSETFGKGDVRGVIAPEAANNAKEGGALIPTLAFGIPGTASMTILLSAFLVHGLVPGPTMLTQHLDLTYAMVWSVAIANVLGAGLCYLMSGHFAKIAALRYTLILPCVLSVIYISAFEGSRQWGDLYVLLMFGVVGWVMKRLGWPRPPLILGFVLGAVIETYMFISIERFGMDWLTRPAVVVILGIALIGLVRPLFKAKLGKRPAGGQRLALGFNLRPSAVFPMLLIAVVGLLLVEAGPWPTNAKLVPMIVGTITISFAALSLLGEVLRPAAAPGIGGATHQQMEIDTDYGDLSSRTVLFRAGIFFGWLLAFMAMMSVIGLIPTIFVFVIAYMRLENRERWTLVLTQAVCMTAFVVLLFDQTLHIQFPPTFLGSWFPALKVIPSL